ncbi:hypothetical protein Pmani_012550 [Petrolisthes manimaculis]|uniref:Uncharacterized protein n=1 Tax=Petrolisthes manimaculis TaxID=1843537 RepID=A0AAE1NVP4_9EUCA|nr:hypothetical protein Pmani_030368 [Petrolisthes manimaculis]KAK4316279.1 hypothetical protein Pmani_012550 [Petrolisthes manimaculis]
MLTKLETLFMTTPRQQSKDIKLVRETTNVGQVVHVVPGGQTEAGRGSGHSASSRHVTPSAFMGARWCQLLPHSHTSTPLH